VQLRRKQLQPGFVNPTKDMHFCIKLDKFSTIHTTNVLTFKVHRAAKCYKCMFQLPGKQHLNQSSSQLSCPTSHPLQAHSLLFYAVLYFQVLNSISIILQPKSKCTIEYRPYVLHQKLMQRTQQFKLIFYIKEKK
jgi:hypothetical protein